MQLAFALQAVTMARFITWFEGRNLPEEDDATQASSDAKKARSGIGARLSASTR